MQKRGSFDIKKIKILILILSLVVILFLGFNLFKTFERDNIKKDFIKKAVLEDNIDLCEQAEDKEKCLLNFALYKRDITLCGQLKNKENIEYCKEQIKLDKILEEKNIEGCEELTILKENCYSFFIEEFNLENES